MKRCLLALLLFTCAASAQNVVVEYGTPNEIPKGGKGTLPESGVLRYFNIWGNGSNRFVHYLIGNNEYTAKLNSDLSAAEPVEVSIAWSDDVVGRPITLRHKGEYWLGNRLVRFVGAYNKTAKKYLLYAVSLNENGAYTGAPIPIDTFDLRQFGGVESFVVISPDLSKVLVYNVPFGNEKQARRVSMKCFDTGLNKLYNTTIKADPYNDQSLVDCAVDNAGNAVLSFGSFNIVYNATKNTVDKITAPVATTGKLMFDDQNRLYAYTPLDRGRFTLLRFKADFSGFDFSIDNTVQSLATAELSPKFFRLKDILAAGAADVVLVYEQSDTAYGKKVWNPELSAYNRGTNSSSVLGESPTVQTPNFYYSDNVIGVCVNTTENATATGADPVKYTFNIPKNQTSTHRSFFMNSLLVRRGDTLYVLYNDELANELINDYKKLKVFRSPRFGVDKSDKDGIVCATVNLKDGTWTKRNLSNAENHFVAQVNSLTQISENEWLLRSALDQTDDYRLVRIRVQ